MAKGQKTGGRVAGTLNKSTRDIKEMAQKYTADALNTLHSIMKSSQQDAARVAASREILDRGHGKASQPITGAGDGPIVVQIVKHADDHTAS